MEKVLLELLEIIKTTKHPATVGWAKGEFNKITELLKDNK